VATTNPPWVEGKVLVAGVAAEVASRLPERRFRATGPMPRRPRCGQDEVVHVAVKEVAAFTRRRWHHREEEGVLEPGERPFLFLRANEGCHLQLLVLRQLRW
jgi:hypothetical protein